METQTKSLYADTHRAFWEKVAYKYLNNVESRTIKDAFIGYVILDWINDVNTELTVMHGLKNMIPDNWGSYENYDQWLLQSMIDKKKIIKQIKKIYKKNKAEIIEVLGHDDPSYVNDISADFYYCNGIYQLIAKEILLKKCLK